MDLQELSKANLVLVRPLHFCAAAFGLYWGVANLALSGCVVPVWHTVAVHIFLRNTLCTLRLGGYCMLSLLLPCERCENVVIFVVTNLLRI